jgi:hypothetical protein
MAEQLFVYLDFRVEDAYRAGRFSLPLPLGEAGLIVEHMRALSQAAMQLRDELQLLTGSTMARKSVPARLRFAILKRDNHTCQYCGRSAAAVALQVDHVIPVARGGLTTWENLRTACEDCNAGKSDGDPSHPPRSQLVRVFLEREGIWVANPGATAEYGPHCL